MFKLLLKLSDALNKQYTLGRLVTALVSLARLIMLLNHSLTRMDPLDCSNSLSFRITFAHGKAVYHDVTVSR